MIPLPKRAVFAGCAKNCATFLPPVLANIERMSTLFAETGYVFVENDSTDETKQVLASWGNGRTNYFGICLDGLDRAEAVRTRRLELARNACIQMIVGNTALASFDYVILIDLDEVNAATFDLSAVRRAIEFLDEHEAAAAVFANQLGTYYDMWALRHAQMCPADVWEEVLDYAVAHGVDDEQAFAATFGRRLFSLPPDSPPVAVDSAFGGFGIYKLAFVARNPNPYLGYKVKLLRRSGTYECRRLQMCEHVHFHRGLRAIGGELFILPWLINRESGTVSFPPSAYRGLLF